SGESLTKLEVILTRSPYLYAAYGLYRETALNLYLDSQEPLYLDRLKLTLQKSAPEYRFSHYHSLDRFWLASYMGEMDLAKQQIVEAQQRGADELTITELDAYMFFNTGQYQAAAESYSRAFKLRSSSRLLYNIAFSYWRFGDLEKAEMALSKMLDIVPANYQANQLQANIWLLQGRLVKAIDAYESINSKNNLRNLTNLSIAYALNKQYKKALKYAKLAVDESPKNTVRLLNLADIEFILGNKESANAHYQQIIDSPVSKNKYRYWLDLAQAYLHLDYTTQSVEALNEAKKLAPENGEVAYTSALIFSELGEYVSATLEVKKALNNKVGVVWFNLPWFDNLCSKVEFRRLMKENNKTQRCFN
ncbi:MAG: tetratricopeptide repeat protein, partial [Colwellia sp.]|nr:tetratricopeptide repeat protein [Colwellia sp.]